MSEATELLEHMEHAGHSGGHGDHGHTAKGPGKGIGITMALLGVMLAFCAAMVGSERTELIKTMVEQSNKWGIYQSETTKFRVIEGDLEMLHALTPSKAEAAHLDETLRSTKARSGKADDEDTAEIKEMIASSIDDVADVLAPDKEDIVHFTSLAKRYDNDVKEAKEDAEAYEGAVRAHERAAEWYERAQLAAEIGIVVASVALLLGSRAIWSISVISGLIGLGVIGFTAVTTHEMLGQAEQKIEEAQKRETYIEKEDEDDDDSEAKKPENGAEAKPAEGKPAEAKPPEAKPADGKTDTAEKPSEPSDSKPSKKE